MPHEGWLSNTFDEDALRRFEPVFAGVSAVFDDRLPLRIALGALAVALPSRNWDTRLIGLVTALECLLRPGDSGTKRRLCERAAVLLHDRQNQRDDVFHDLGSIYDARSILVHGRELQIDDSKSRWVMMRLECILQGAARKVLSSPELIATFADSNAHGRFFQRALHGVDFDSSSRRRNGDAV